MVTEGGGVAVVSGLDVSVCEGAVDGAWVGEASGVLAVVLTLFELAATVMPTLVPGPPAPVPPTRRGLSSDCWITFTPSGLLHDDSLVLAL